MLAPVVSGGRNPPFPGRGALGGWREVWGGTNDCEGSCRPNDRSRRWPRETRERCGQTRRKVR